MNRPPLPRRNEPHAVYRIRDADDRLLYVGCSFGPLKRVAEHCLRKAWRKTIAKVDLEWHDNFDDAYAAEAEAIASEHPLWNIHHKQTERNFAVGIYDQSYDESDPETWVRKVSS